MKRDWIKLDVGILDDPAYGTLTDDLWRLIIQLNMMAGETDQEGLLPKVRDMAWELHINLGQLQISLHHLSERGLVHSTPQGWVVTGFKESQSAPNSTERSRAFRMRRKSATQDKQAGNEKGVGSAARSAAKEEVQEATQAAAEMQPVRPQPVAGSVPTSDRDLAQPGKNRRRHKAKGQPVEKSVDTCPADGFPQEKGRNNSDSTPGTSSTSSLIKSLKPSLNIKLTLLELPDRAEQEKGRNNSDPMLSTSSTSSLINSLKPSFKTSLNIKLPLLEPGGELEPEKFRASQAKSLENRRVEPGSKPFANAQQPEAQQARVRPEILRKPVEPHPVDTYPADKHVVKAVDTCPVDGFPQEKGRKFSDPDERPP